MESNKTSYTRTTAMMKMPRRLVNEKTLELNIAHEGMSLAGVGVFGFTQQQESRIGADVLFPYGKPRILQFKAAKSGVDASWAKFQVNNNKLKNQHQALDAIARSGVCDARYAFPLIVSDTFLTSNFGNLFNFTRMVNASQLTGNLNWIGQAHTIEVQKNCGFTVTSSEEVKGEGISAKQFFETITKEREGEHGEKTDLSDFTKDLIERLDRIVQKARVHGQSEHTLVIMGTDRTGKRLGYLQLPVRLRGLQESSRERGEG